MSAPAKAAAALARQAQTAAGAVGQQTAQRARPSGPTALSTLVLQKAQQTPSWLWANKRNLALLSGSAAAGATSYHCMNRIPGGHAGLVRDLEGGDIVRDTIFDENQVALLNPFRQELVPMRLLPVKKRFIRTFTTKDDRLEKAGVRGFVAFNRSFGCTSRGPSFLSNCPIRSP